MHLKQSKFFLFVLAGSFSLLVACTNGTAKETTTTENQKQENTPSGFSHLMTNYRVKEGYLIKVYRNDQKEYPIFFKGLQAALMFDEKKPESSKLSASIEVATIESGNNEMNAHAKEKSVLDAQLFPIITFESTLITKKDTGYEATGKLNLKGITKEIKLPFIFRNDTFSGKFAINAKDFEITRNGAVPSGIIKIELIIPVTK